MFYYKVDMMNNSDGDIRTINATIADLVKRKPEFEEDHKQYKKGFFERTYKENIYLAHQLFGEYIKFKNKELYFSTILQ